MKILIEINGKEESLTAKEARRIYDELQDIFVVTAHLSSVWQDPNPSGTKVAVGKLTTPQGIQYQTETVPSDYKI